MIFKDSYYIILSKDLFFNILALPLLYNQRNNLQLLLLELLVLFTIDTYYNFPIFLHFAI